MHLPVAKHIAVAADTTQVPETLGQDCNAGRRDILELGTFVDAQGKLDPNTGDGSATSKKPTRPPEFSTGGTLITCTLTLYCTGGTIRLHVRFVLETGKLVPVMVLQGEVCADVLQQPWPTLAILQLCGGRGLQDHAQSNTRDGRAATRRAPTCPGRGQASTFHLPKFCGMEQYLCCRRRGHNVRTVSKDARSVPQPAA